MDVTKKNVPQISKPFNFRLIHIFCFVIFLSLGIMIYISPKTFPQSLQLFRSVESSASPPPIPPPLPSPSPPPPPPPPSNSDINVFSLNETKSLMHNMTDEELLLRASTVTDFSDVKFVPKVAFMFMARDALPFAPLWEKFFSGHDGLYSIYLHQHPDFIPQLPEDSVFYRRQIPSQPVIWGTILMIDAEKRLLASALLDPTNQRFVLLSESCIPLFNFTSTYNYLIDSERSFLGSFDDPRNPGRGRYNPQMSPQINLTDWRKGAQWFELHRDLAVKVISDTKYYGIFRNYCLPPCYNDEFYMPTFVSMEYGQLNSNRSTTFVDWSRGGPHPRKFTAGDIAEELLNHIRFGFECIYNGNVTSMCFLFARKFHPNTLGRLLKIAPLVLGFGG